VEELITNRTVGPLQGFRSRMGKPFIAVLKLSDDFKTEFDFGQNDNEADAEPVDFSGQHTLGACPKCGGAVFSHGVTYICEKATGPNRSCDFRSGKIILQRPIEAEQMRKLLTTGKTDLLHRFISKKGRPFSAYLARGEDGKVTFEFAPRAPKEAKAKAPAKSRKAVAT
jgi:DNA topoisomerase-3